MSGIKDSDHGLDHGIKDFRTENAPQGTTHRASPYSHRTDSQYFVLFKKAALRSIDGILRIVGVGPTELTNVTAHSWDRAFERREDWNHELYLVGRARDGEVEVFDDEDLNALMQALPNLKVGPYRLLDPPSIYPGKLRSQRTIKEKLTDAFQESMRVEHGDIEYAIMAGGEPNNFLLIASLGRERYSRDQLNLETITVCGRTYPVVGHIVDNQVVFTAQVKDLSQYLGKKEGADYVEWRWLDFQKQSAEREMQERQSEHKRRQRQAKKKRRELETSGGASERVGRSESSSDDQRRRTGSLYSSASEIGGSSTELESEVDVDQAISEIRKHARVMRD